MVMGLFVTVSALQAQTGYLPSAEINAAKEKFQDNKFGIFIHWGIYSMPGQGEWVMQSQNLNYQEYSKLASGFFPAKFDAQKWVSDIKASGAKYICITSRHHDGFSMFGSKMTDYNIVDATPFGRDVLKELSLECARQDIALHFYYSLVDWYRDDYLPLGRTGRGTGRPGKGDPSEYFKFMKGQITELLTDYGKIGCIWFDGHWDRDEDAVPFDWQYDTIYPLIHSLQHDCLVANNHHLSPFEGEDIQVFERDMPGENTEGYYAGSVSKLPLETCNTMNDSWGYRLRDQNYKSVPYLIKYLVGTAGRNANLLLNVGPQPNGEIPAAAIERLKSIGEWLAVYGESIYGTRSELVPPQPWGVTTHKGDKMWVHVFPDDYKSSKCSPEIFIPYGNHPKLKMVTVFGTSDKLQYKEYKEGIFVTLPQLPDVPDYVVEMTFK